MYHVSGAVHFGPGEQMHLYGDEGTIKYQMSPQEQLWAARRGDPQLQLVDVPLEEVYEWRVEKDFIEAIRGQRKIELTDFPKGVRYMEFTEAVARSAQTGSAVDLPLS